MADLSPGHPPIPDVCTPFAVACAAAAWDIDQAGLFRKLLQNVADNPQEPKYRRLRLTNARIAALIEKVPKTREMLEASGWISAEEGTSLELPASASLELLNTIVGALPVPASASTGPRWKLEKGAEVWPMTVMRGPLKV